jgi:DNA polymerase
MKSVLKHEKAFCEGCPLNRNKAKKTHYIPTEVHYDRVGPEGHAEVDILVVGDAPGKSEDDNGMPFTGPSGEELKISLKKIGIEGSFALANSIRCRPTDDEGNNRPPSIEEIAACGNYIKQDLIQLKPKVVVLMGNTAKDILAPTPEWRTKGISKLSGEIFVTNGVTYTATVNPSSFLRNNNYMERQRFHRHIGNIGRILSGEQGAFSRKGVSTLLRTEKAAIDFLDLLENFETDFVCVDTETENLNRVAPNKLATIQFAVDNDIGFVLPLEHWQSPWTPEFLEYLRERLARIFSNPEIKIGAWVAHGSKFDYGKITKFCRIIKIALPIMDPIFMEYLRDENQRRGMDDGGEGGLDGSGGTNFDLKTMAKDKLGFYYYNEKILEVRKDGSLVEEPLWNPDNSVSEFTIYAGMDVYIGRRLICYIINELGLTEHKEKSINFAKKWGTRVTHLLTKIEANGCFADKDQLEYLRSDDSPILKRMDEIPGEITSSPEGKKANQLILSKDPRTKGMKPLFGKAPIVFDIDKKDHRVALLVDTCKLEPLAYGKKEGEAKSKYAKKGKNGEIDKGNGVPSINKAFFQEYKDHPFAALVQEYEGLKKLKSSYLNSVMSFLTDDIIYTKRGPKSNADNLFDGRIHPTFWDSKTVTGRFAASDPNTQQLPRAEGFAKSMIKSMYGAAPGHVMLEADFGQAEIRWWAQIAKDQEFANLFNGMVSILEEFERNPTPELAIRVSNECDIHKQVSAAMNRVPIEQVSKDMRQAAKGLCVAPGTLIRTPEGLIPIEEVINSWKGSVLLETRKGVEEANRTFEITVNRTQKVKTSRGYTIHGRPEHPVLVWRSCKLQFVELQNLNSEDRIVTRRNAKLWPEKLVKLEPSILKSGEEIFPKEVTPDLARLLGYITSEGTTGYEKFIRIPNTDERVIADLRELLTSNFGKEAFAECTDDRSADNWKNITKFTINSTAARYLRKLGVVGIEDSYTKVVPKAIMRSPRHVVIEYLRGYLAGDASSNFHRVKACTASKQLAKEIQILLLDLGIVAKRDGSYRKTNKGEGFYWDVTAVGKEAERCWAIIPPIRPLDEAYEKEYNNAQLDHIYGLRELAKKFADSNYREKGNKENGGYWKYPGFPWTRAETWTLDFCYKHKEKIIKGFKARDEQLALDFEEILTQGYFLDSIVENEVIDQDNQTVYDFTVPGSHSFVTNGIVGSNSFGSLYGMSPKSLAMLVKCSEFEAKQLIQTFTNKFERAGGWLEYIEDFAMENGYVISPFGRARHLAPLIELNEGAARRVARNSPIQGAASDTTAMGAWLIQDWIERTNRPYKIWNVVHDAISIEVPLTKEAIIEVMAVMKNYMTKEINPFLKQEFNINLIVPLVIDFKVGLRWGHCKTVDPLTDIDQFVATLQEQDRRLHNGDKWWQLATELEVKKLEKDLSKIEKEKKENWEKEIAKRVRMIEEHRNSLLKAG